MKIDSEPNFERLEKVLTREEKPDRIPFYEHGNEIEEKVLDYLDVDLIPYEEDMSKKERARAELKNHVKHQKLLGYDYADIAAIGAYFPGSLDQGKAGVTLSTGSQALTAQTQEGERVFQHSSKNIIGDREDFKEYPWPSVDDLDFSPYKWGEELLPEGMKGITVAPGGIFEHLMWLVGFKKMSYMIKDNADLIKDIVDKIGEILADYLEKAASFDIIGAVAMGDDLGFKSGTLISPESLREYIFPWHDEIVSRIHEHGKPAILHSCGNLRDVREDIIESGWDAKHSYQDVIEPIWEAKKAYGEKVTVVGGFDMDKISRMNTDEVVKHTRKLIDKTAKDGFYALGTGNSVTDYVPVENYLAMIEEGFEYGKL